MLHKWVRQNDAFKVIARQLPSAAGIGLAQAMARATTTWRYGDNDALLSRKGLMYLAAFYLGIPVAFALWSGAAEGGSFIFVDKRYYFYYFLAAWLPSWWAQDLCTRVVKRILEPWGPPLIVILVIGAIAGLNLQGLWSPLRHSYFAPYLAEGSSFYSVFPWRFSDPDYLVEALVAWLSGSVVWASANLIFIHVLGFPRFGYRKPATADTTRDPSPEGDSDSSPPASGLNILLNKLPENLGREIVALKAEEHYTRVYTKRGEALVLMRFSDAVGLLSELGGLQTHRSYWANPEYIEELVRDGRSSHVHLSTGIDLPVSRSYRVKVQEAMQSFAH